MIEKRLFDKEYCTDYLKEKDYLRDVKGIRYTFAKTRENGIKEYKYKKTPELFLALAEFYGQF